MVVVVFVVVVLGPNYSNCLFHSKINKLSVQQFQKSVAIRRYSILTSNPKIPSKFLVRFKTGMNNGKF